VIPFSASPGLARRLHRLRFGALVALGMLIAHDAIFAAGHGLGAAREAALAATAHGYWPLFAAVVLVAGIALAGGATAGLLRLRRALRGLPGTADPDGLPGYGAELGHLWPRLMLAVTAGFVLQENIEHAAAGLKAPGLWVLSGPAYPLSIPVLAGVTLLLAAAGAWFRWRTLVLAGRLAAARAAIRHAGAPDATPASRWGLVAALVAHGRMLLRSDAGRAPPARAGA